MSKKEAKLEKLIITPYSDGKFNSAVKDKKFTATINPENYTHSFSSNFSNDAVINASAKESKFQSSDLGTVSFDLILDDTGAIPKVKGQESATVENQIKKFKEATYIYDGDNHQPFFVRISWGKNLQFRGRLSNCTIKVEMMKPNGTPLRANINATFQGYIDPPTRASKENKSSPDLSHLRVIRQGDTLPNMCYKIYGDPAYYLEVARANGLVSFRQVKPGMKIYFPPIKG
ncbi:MAG: LysM peptidoglycan-binding domain-containing protein [Bernardetiaceae bacterium]|nr:LysM peptidoglycan-binding domain-containing protein [Bernardetiaceae bacterium]